MLTLPYINTQTHIHIHTLLDAESGREDDWHNRTRAIQCVLLEGNSQHVTLMFARLHARDADVRSHYEYNIIYILLGARVSRAIN